MMCFRNLLNFFVLSPTLQIYPMRPNHMVPMYYSCNFGIVLLLQVTQNDNIFTTQHVVLNFAHLITYHPSAVELLNSAGQSTDGPCITY